MDYVSWSGLPEWGTHETREVKERYTLMRMDCEEQDNYIGRVSFHNLSVSS